MLEVAENVAVGCADPSHLSGEGYVEPLYCSCPPSDDSDEAGCNGKGPVHIGVYLDEDEQDEGGVLTAVSVGLEIGSPINDSSWVSICYTLKPNSGSIEEQTREWLASTFLPNGARQYLTALIGICGGVKDGTTHMLEPDELRQYIQEAYDQLGELPTGE